MALSPSMLSLSSIQWDLGMKGIPFDTNKIAVDAAGKITKWLETRATQPTEAELTSITANYQKAYAQAITDYSEYSDFYDNMIAKINGIPNCEELVAYAQTMVTDYFLQKIDDVTKKISDLAALGGDGSLSLGNLGSVISWITKYVNTNLVGPYAKATALLAITIAKQAELTAAVANKVAELGCII